VTRISLKDPPEVFVSTAAMSAAVSRAVAAGKLRRLARVSTNRTEDAASLVRCHLWEIAAGFFPDGLLSRFGTATEASLRHLAVCGALANKSSALRELHRTQQAISTYDDLGHRTLEARCRFPDTSPLQIKPYRP
jgi:hypothetical protein